jgi:hypothetical protein
MLRIQTDTERVAAAGAALLDQMRPGWANVINLNRLDLRGEYCCVLGQLYGSYSKGVQQVFGEQLTREGALGHGFNQMSAPIDTYVQRWEALNAAWRVEIENRMSVAA